MKKVQRYDVRPAVYALAATVRAGLAAIGSGAAFAATVAGGAVAGLSVSAPGSGYGSYSKLTFSGTGEMADAVARLDGGAFDMVQVLSGGRDYTAPPTVRAEPYLNEVYDNVPLMFSDSAPFMFFDYVGGPNEPLDEFEMTTRIYTVNAIACQALAQETSLADMRTKEFVGVFYDLIWNNPTLDDRVARCIVVADTVQTVVLNGADSNTGAVTRFLGNVFTVQITEAQG